MSDRPYTFHLLGNAHLDPVWFWDWREGLNEGLRTVRTLLDLMEEFPEMTLIRGEAWLYEAVEEHEPETFARVRALVEAGRWDVVGGTYIQPDTNLPATETLLRQFQRGQHYFQSRFGRAPRVAWAADSFGHSAGLPEILGHVGIENFAFTRPEAKYTALAASPFWWESAAGTRVLAYRPITGWYGCERDEVFKRLDDNLAAAREQAVGNIGLFYGVGNHGGGPTRRQLEDIRRWADKHPEVEVVHSGLHRFFEALRREEGNHVGGYAVHQGELNYCLRGCYASVAKFKFPFRLAEGHVARAEKTDAAISAALAKPGADLAAAWDALLFNSFHDILPGSSIERAYEDQLAWLGTARHAAHQAELRALNALAARVDTTVPAAGNEPSLVPLLAWNPHPQAYRGPLEAEVSLDYRPIWEYENRADQVPLTLRGPDGREVPFQRVRTEHSSLPHLPWRARVVFQADIPAMGWAVYQLGYASSASAPTAPPLQGDDTFITNGNYAVRVSEDRSRVEITRDGESLFPRRGLAVRRVNDPWGSWGGMFEEPASFHLDEVLEDWPITQSLLLEAGPERSSLWIRFSNGRSRLDLTFTLVRDRPSVDVHARVFWNERGSRLKLVFPMRERATYEVPGGTVERGEAGEVPGGRWVGLGSWGFASNALYSFRQREGEFEATVVRASRYANDVFTGPEEEPWRPAVDAGELCFRFLLTDDVPALPRLSRLLEQEPLVLAVVPSPGAWPRTGSLLSLAPASAEVLALQPAREGGGWILRVQEREGKAQPLTGLWQGSELGFGQLRPFAIQSFEIRRADGGNGWFAREITLLETKSTATLPLT
jgi:alpha-mannosidase